eukprot:CAMPEP_0178430792 /NCGR_PEP_ID=MMETSP0689_2-20121128/31504_1 /TAXON_ID=160604 /ORGANISM="Amphidinium massartii, Strain CS-259" /LENGTH=57 /DNA_ID=CAMNT_0020052663 /DNA_START=253 /DNA_END=426 /DNA_ORIENTATION=-
MSSEKVKLYKVDVDNQQAGSICQTHNVSAMPTLVLVKGGKEVDRMEGVNKAKLDSWM